MFVYFLHVGDSKPIIDSMEYDGDETITILHDITISLESGSLLGVCGSVGSGKTSLMQAILSMVST